MLLILFGCDAANALFRPVRGKSGKMGNYELAATERQKEKRERKKEEEEERRGAR